MGRVGALGAVAEVHPLHALPVAGEVQAREPERAAAADRPARASAASRDVLRPQRDVVEPVVRVLGRE